MKRTPSLTVEEAAYASVCACITQGGLDRCLRNNLSPGSLAFRRAVRGIAERGEDINPYMLLSMLLALMYGQEHRLLRVPTSERPHLALTLVELLVRTRCVSLSEFTRTVCNATGDSSALEVLFGPQAVERALAAS